MNTLQLEHGSACTAENLRLLGRAQWLIALRWIAIIGVLAAGFAAHSLFGIPIHQDAVYGSALFLGVYNTVLALLLKRMRRSGDYRSGLHIRFLVDGQIVLDLITLTVLLHFAGGLENPFAAYYVFHMGLASIILSVGRSYLHAALACLLFALMVLLEYRGWLPHYCIVGGGEASLHDHGLYMAATIFGLGTTLFLVVFLTGSVGVLLKNKERAWREANVQLKQKDRVKDEYVARVSHDIKGDLAAIHNCLDVAVNTLGNLPDDPSDLIRRALRRTDRLNCFVRDLLLLTRMRLNDRMCKQAFSLADVLEKVVSAASETARAKGVDLQSHVDLSNSLVLGAPFSIEEAIGNLVDNAVKYTPSGGAVIVSACDVGGHLEIAVSDTGIGIPAEEINSIFDEFFRASNTQHCAEGGTGLGLSIVKQIIDRHGGQIYVASQLARGAVFTVTLPAYVPAHVTIREMKERMKGASVAAARS